MAVVALEKAQGTRVGGKAANLGELLRMGIEVPPGFVVDADEFDKHFNGECTSIKNILDLMRLSGLLEQVSKAYDKMGAGKVAVRSSAVGEDGSILSFAGQHDTYLSIEGRENVIAAMLKCWASINNTRASEYRKSNGVKKASMAVVVQRMVDSEVSGVMFTVDPTQVVDGSMMVVEAVWGLGETIVSGTITPDRYMIHKSGKLTEMRIVAQDWALRDGAQVPIDTELQVSPKLTKAQILQLADMGMKLELEYGWPQDIEWALAGGQIYIVQSRPITTLKKESKGKVGITGKILAKGIGASGGAAAGEGTIYSKTFKSGVLVTELTDPDYLPAMKKAVAVVTGKGGMTCHAAIVCRELGIPCVVGVGEIEHLIGKDIMVNGDVGVVTSGFGAPDKDTETTLKPKPTPKAIWVTPKVGNPSVKEKVEKIVGPVEVILAPAESAPTQQLEDGGYIDPAHLGVSWVVYKGIGYPFPGKSSIEDVTLVIKQLKSGFAFTAGILPKALVPLKPAAAPITDKDLELLPGTLYGKAPDMSASMKSITETDKYVYLKITSYPEGPAEAKYMGGKYNPNTKTWAVLKSEPGLKHLKYLKVVA